MIPAAFDFVTAESAAQAVACLAEYGEEAKLIAGGHSLIPLMKLRFAYPSVLIDIGRLQDLAYIRDEGAEIAIGALTRYRALEVDPTLREHLPLVAHVAGVIGDPQVRHRGTIGGSLAHGDAAADMPAAVLALGGSMVVQSPRGERTVPASAFFHGFLETALEPDEMVTEIRLPKATGAGWSYQKFRRRALDWAIVGVAAVRNGSTAVAMVNMAPTPVRADAVEAALADGASIADAAQLAGAGAEPPSDLNADPEFRRHLARVLVGRALTEADARGRPLTARPRTRQVMTAAGEVLWTPPADVWQTSQVGRFAAWLATERGLQFATYPELWEWSVRDLDGFWGAIWDYFGIKAAVPYEAVLGKRAMPGAEWFPGARLNYAEQILSGARRVAHPDGAAIVSLSQTRPDAALPGWELEEMVARARAGLVRLGVERGDRVAAYLPSLPETVAAYLGCLSLGAVWSSCAPEFGTRSVVDRLGQIQPKVLLTVDGYRFGDKPVDRAGEVADIRAALPSLQHVVLLPYLYPDEVRVPNAIPWKEFAAETDGLEFEQLPFDHPMHILFSSGTTGLPKPIVHGHGGVLLDQLKSMTLHQNLGPEDRLFFFSTTGWMAWNWLVSALAGGTSVVLADGNLLHPDLSAAWRTVAEQSVTVYGVSPAFLTACRKSDIVPRTAADLAKLRGISAGGSPLTPDMFRWVYDAVGEHVFLQSFSGGTEICGGFVGGVPTLPVRAGEITCRWLGCKVEAYDTTGRSVCGEEGELVLTEPLPSMPLGLWDDLDGSRFRATYFERFPGVWHHGDRVTISAHGTVVISGRSDATLNRGGVRLGTGEFYTVVEALSEIADSLVVHLEDADGGAGELILFVVLADQATLTAELHIRIGDELRRNLSPRHVPDRIEAVAAIPRTITGKKLEVPVKRILQGTAAEAAASHGALQDPAALDAFVALAQTREQ